MIQINLFTKLKQTHRHRKQTQLSKGKERKICGIPAMRFYSSRKKEWPSATHDTDAPQGQSRKLKKSDTKYSSFRCMKLKTRHNSTKTQRGKNSLFNQQCWDKWDNHKPKNNWTPTSDHRRRWTQNGSKTKK